MQVVESVQVVESHRAHGGTQLVVAHRSRVLGCDMRLGVFLPPGDDGERPVLYFLSGLTCTEQNVVTKGFLQPWCAERGLILVAPDTSPRGADVADDPAWDLGQGAGFYLSATVAPWSAHYRMDAYVADELPELARAWTRSEARGVTGHSMGGHGALTLALKRPGLYRSVSAFAPILQPSDVPWGVKAFTAYLGEDRDRWAAYDATRLLASARERLPIRIDQGDADPFLADQLRADAFLAAARAARHPVAYHLRPGYDHSYYFVASFAREHVDHHADALVGPR